MEWAGGAWKGMHKLWNLVLLMNWRPDKLRTPRLSQICRSPALTRTGCVVTDHTEMWWLLWAKTTGLHVYLLLGTFWACTKRPQVLQCDLPLLLASLFIWLPHWVTMSGCELCDETSKYTMQTAIWYQYQQQYYFNNKNLINNGYSNKSWLWSASLSQ